MWTVCLCYLDPQVLFERLGIALDRLGDVDLKASPSKCELFKTEIKFLGHMVSADGIDPLPEKSEAMRNWLMSHWLRDVRAFVGLASNYRPFVQGFATIAEPLSRLTGKMARFE